MFACHNLRGPVYTSQKVHYSSAMYIQVVTALLKIDSWVRKADRTELFKLKQNTGVRINGHKQPMIVFRLEMRKMSLTIRR